MKRKNFKNKHVAAGQYMSHTKQERHIRENNSNNHSNNYDKRINSLRKK